MSFAQIERRRIELRDMKAAEIKRHEDALDAIGQEWLINNNRFQILNAGLDESRILLASHVLEIGGDFNYAQEGRTNAINEAIEHLVNGGSGLREKITVGRTGGSCDFTISLSKPVKERSADALINDEELDACIYYLRNIGKIQYSLGESYYALLREKSA